MKTIETISHSVGLIRRGDDRSAVQLAAYCGRTRLQNTHNGLTYDYTHKRDLAHHEILLPDHALRTYLDQGTLWNAVEQVEKNRNARLARSVRLALPRCLDATTHINMVCRYVKENFVDQGMCADVSIHDKGDGNPHVHVLLTTRSLDENGQWMYKQRRNYLLDEHGNKIYDPLKNRYLQGRNIRANDWEEGGNFEKWRKGWADTCNREFRRLGLEREVTHMSYARQGSDREPTKHLGARVKALEDRGIQTDRGNINREIEARNREHEERQRERERQRNRSHSRSR